MVKRKCSGIKGSIYLFQHGIFKIQMVKGKCYGIKGSIYLFQHGINTNGQEKMLWYILMEPFTSCKAQM